MTLTSIVHFVESPTKSTSKLALLTTPGTWSSLTFPPTLPPGMKGMPPTEGTLGSGVVTSKGALSVLAPSSPATAMENFPSNMSEEAEVWTVTSHSWMDW